MVQKYTDICQIGEDIRIKCQVCDKNRRNHVYRNRRREGKSPLYTGDRRSGIPGGSRKVLEGTRIGDSIAVNGVCLTVTSIQPDGFTADVMAETIRRSSLGVVPSKTGSPNLERAVAADGGFRGTHQLIAY